MTVSPSFRAAVWVVVLLAAIVPVTAEEHTSTPQPITRWEYKSLKVGRNDLAVQLNKYGAEGWECFSVTIDADVEVVLKRPISASPKAATAEPTPPPAVVAERKPVNEKAKLAELAQQIIAKEAELAALKTRAAALRQWLAANEKPKDDKIYRSVADLFADMPKEAYPRGGSDGGIERAKAVKWCEANLIGRVVEWTATVKNVTIEGADEFRVDLLLEPAGNDEKKSEGMFNKAFLLGDQSCLMTSSTQEGAFSGHSSRMEQRYSPCTAAEAEVLRKMKGKEVTFRAPIRFVNVYSQSDKDVLIRVQTLTPSIDGLLPESARTRQEAGAR